jgi:DNA-directed RNA polymerase specialized sigma24 family protein
MVDSQESVSFWIARLKTGDEEAAQRIWERFYSRLASFCRGRIPDAIRRVSDEEDVALSALAQLFDGAAEGRFPQLSDRDDLWRLLLAIATRKISRRVQWYGRQKRGSDREATRLRGADRDAHNEAVDQVADDEPTPETAVLMADACEALMKRLPDDTFRAVAKWKLQSYTNREIAERLGCSLRSVERMLQLIREKWCGEVAGPEETLPE